MKEVMNDLEAVLAGSVNRPSQYPPELIEQVLWQTERLWHAMSAKAALLHAQAQVPARGRGGEKEREKEEWEEEKEEGGREEGREEEGGRERGGREYVHLRSS